MAEFFDQICAVLTENGKKYPGMLADSVVIREFFSPVPERKPVVSEGENAVRQKEVSAVTAGGSLNEICVALEGCSRCPLCRFRNTIVPGEGNEHAGLMFVGEAPGHEEDLQGRPFVGKAGQLLDKMISAMQFTREEVYITNIVKCRPQNNRNPMPEEIAQCIQFLHRQIEIIRPEVIVALGAVAAKALLATENGISKLRGKWCSYNNIPVMPTFHPAYLLRNESAKRDAWKDLQLVMARFGKTYRR